jgi:hypothetical protein
MKEEGGKRTKKGRKDGKESENPVGRYDDEMILQSCDWFFRKGFLNKTEHWLLTSTLFLSTLYIDVRNRCPYRYVVEFSFFLFIGLRSHT